MAVEAPAAQLSSKRPEELENDKGFEAQKDTTVIKEADQYVYESSSLPFGQHVELSSVSGPTYLTAQTLIQQVAFTLSDKIFTYSPETFDLDLALRRWQSKNEKNAFGYETGVAAMETRAGAGSIALGYMFSQDFDLEKRHIPQSIVASSATLHHLRPALDQLSLLYSVANPVVAHVAAVDYASTGFVTDYVTAMTQADELGLGLVASTSSYESQHMSLLATLLAKIMPSIHIYDGISIGRETTRIVDVLGQKGLFDAYKAIDSGVDNAALKHTDNEGKFANLLTAFNEELGTDYKVFEYYGHAEPESVLVVFGSVEASLAAQLSYALGNNGAKVGAINVRVYRPFLEEEFLDAIPKTVQSIAVLGQVQSSVNVTDAFEHSKLYSDVLASVSFSTRFQTAPSVIDIKYAREEVWSPSKMLFVLQNTKLGLGDRPIVASLERPDLDLLGPAVKRYTLWDLDESPSADAAAVIGQVLSQGSSENVSIRTGYDNLVRGGLIRTDIRCSDKSIEAPYPISSSELTYVGEEKLLTDFDILGGLQSEGTLVLRLPSSKEMDMEKLEKKLPEVFRSELVKKAAKLFLYDPSVSSKVSEDAKCEILLTELLFLRFASEDGNSESKIKALAAINGDSDLLQALSADLDAALRQIELPEDWNKVDPKSHTGALSTEINVNSFAAHSKQDTEPPTFLKTWITAAKGFAFKEATGFQNALRPDLGIKTHMVTVKERRRLTPLSYDRNIFHIEFDLGNTGLTYAIGEALGIHAENDLKHVEDFIKWYDLDPSAVVEVPSREDFDVLENRTVYQSLMQNIDIFGRPPKRFYEALAEFADDEGEKKQLLALGGSTGEGQQEFKRRAEVDTVTYADVLLEFPSAHPSFHEIVRMVAPMKRREYSIASSQKVTPNSVSLLIVTVGWVDPKGRDRFGQATRFLNALHPGTSVTVSVKPSVMKLPTKSTAPLIMAGLGTGLAPFRAFVQERAWQKQQGMEIGAVLLYMGARHQREEYLYGEEWEAYRDAGVITLMGCAFSRDQAEKIYIQDRMRESMKDIRQAYLKEEGSFYLCGPTWPVPDVTEVLKEAVTGLAVEEGRKVDGNREIERLKDEGRYVLEVY